MDTQSQSNKHTVRNLAIFTFLVIALPWLGRGLDSLMGSTSSQEGLGLLIWIITPLAASFLLRAFAGDGWKDLGIRPAIKGNGLWYAVSILVYPVCTALVLVIGLALGAVSFPDFWHRFIWPGNGQRSLYTFPAIMLQMERKRAKKWLPEGQNDCLCSLVPSLRPKSVKLLLR